jgi:hypothetical protein
MNHIAMLIRNLANRMMTLFLLKHIPKSYILLWTLLTLPSKRTLQFISTVHFRTSIYARVFGTLKHSLQRTYRKDRLCCLKLDEVSVRENLRNRSLDYTEAFEYLEMYGRTRGIANHALVSIICGLRKNRKQPAAYYFSCGSNKVKIILQFLSEVLHACRNASWIVVNVITD